MVRRSELRNIKAEVRLAFDNPIEGASNWAFLWFGIGGGAAITILALLAVQGDRLRAGVVAALVAAAIGGIFLGAFCHWFGRRSHEAKGNLRDHAIDQLDELDKRAPPVVSDEVVNSIVGTGQES